MGTRFMKARGLVVLAKVEFGGACTQEIKGDSICFPAMVAHVDGVGADGRGNLGGHRH